MNELIELNQLELDEINGGQYPVLWWYRCAVDGWAFGEWLSTLDD